MKTKFNLAITSLILLAACGGGGGGDPVIEGPIMSIDQVKTIVVDQFYVNGGLEGEYSSQGEYSVYLRDPETGEDVACTKAEDGMAKLAIPAMYYGGLAILLKEVEGNSARSMMRYQVIFVEQDSGGCPAPIDDDDDIVGVSAELQFDDFLDQRVWATNGRGAVVLRARSEESTRLGQMSPSLSEELAIDKLYYDNGADDEEEGRYYIYADVIEDGGSVANCQIEDSLMDNIKYGDIVYASLGYPFACLPSTDPNFASKVVKIALYYQRDSGPVLVGETDASAVSELIGEKVEFTNGTGYISFRGIETTPFNAALVRLGDLTDIAVTDLAYQPTPSHSPTIEIHAVDPDAGFMIACAGEDQGLTDVGSPGTYVGLNAGLVASSGQVELFGFEGVKFELVNRTDGLACPSPVENDPEVLATTESLVSSELGPETIEFNNGLGSVTFKLE